MAVAATSAAPRIAARLTFILSLVSACETNPLKVLATRRYPGPAFEELRDLEVRALREVQGARSDVEALVVANEPVPADLLPGLRLVANFGVGYDRVGAEELRRRGVAVTNTPGVLDAATADLTWALILAVRRRVVEGDLRVRGRRVDRPLGGRLPCRGADWLDTRDRRAGTDRPSGRAARPRVRAARSLHPAASRRDGARQVPRARRPSHGGGRRHDPRAADAARRRQHPCARARRSARDSG